MSMSWASKAQSLLFTRSPPCPPLFSYLFPFLLFPPYFSLFFAHYPFTPTYQEGLSGAGQDAAPDAILGATRQSRVAGRGRASLHVNYSGQVSSPILRERSRHYRRNQRWSHPDRRRRHLPLHGLPILAPFLFHLFVHALRTKRAVCCLSRG
jgi:hypothetical protein